MKYDSLLSEKVKLVPPSGIRKFFDIAATMKDCISLGVGEPDFTTPWNVCEAAMYSIEHGQTHYTSNWGLIQLRRLIARYLRERCRLEYNPDNEIIVTVGASEGIDLCMRAILNPGDEVMVPDPSYVSYMPCVSLADGVIRPVLTRAEDSFRLTPDALRAAITPRTKALILPYPNNPTGGVMRREDLEAIAEVLRDTNILVLSDEIYSELTYGEAEHVSIGSLPGMWERTITINGFSKAFAMTGWRMGYICAPREICAQMVKIHQYTALCAPVQGQAAAIEALENAFETDFAEVRRMRAIYDQRRRLMLDGFEKMGLPCFTPEGAFYLFPDIRSTGYSSADFCEKLLYGKHVAVVPGGAFGKSGEGFIRCSYATATDKLSEALRRMDAFLQKA